LIPIIITPHEAGKDIQVLSRICAFRDFWQLIVEVLWKLHIEKRVLHRCYGDPLISKTGLSSVQ